MVLPTHDWVVYNLSTLFGSVRHKVKIHKITPASGKERGDIEEGVQKDYVVLPRGQDNGPLKDSVRTKIRHYQRLYLDHPDPLELFFYN